MKRIFIYEHLTGGGLLEEQAPSESLLREGAAMLQAVVADFTSMGCQVDAILDARVAGQIDGLCVGHSSTFGEAKLHLVKTLNEREAAFDVLAAEADWSLIIAPETNGMLAKIQSKVPQAGGNLLGTNHQLTELASSKTATAEFLATHGIAVPRGRRISNYEDTPCPPACCPAVLKPDDGCGSVGIQRISNHDEWQQALAVLNRTISTDWRLEEQVAGIAASVTLILGPDSEIILPPCVQHLGGASGFEFMESEPISDPELVARAQRLATQVAHAIRTLTDKRPSLGWLGIDVVLGIDSPTYAEGDQPQLDVVIELNPRLTSSYISLQELKSSGEVNLAEIMLNAAEGLCSTGSALA